MAWEKINEMFPDDYVVTPDGPMQKELFLQQNFDKISIKLSKPIRSAIEYEEQIIWYNNGDMDRFFTYSIFPYVNIDNQPLFNIYGQKVYNDFLKELD